MAHMLGGKVGKSLQREFGHGTLSISKKGKLFAGLPKILRVWNSHGDRLEKLPRGFEAIASTENSPFATIQDAKRNFYGMQFHPEVEITHLFANKHAGNSTISFFGSVSTTISSSTES